MTALCLFLLLTTLQSLSSLRSTHSRWTMRLLDRLPQRLMGVEPVITVKEPLTGTTVHVVGVSHGSPVSAELVQRVIRKVKPTAVVLELCDDRFLSMSLEAKIRPRHNTTLENYYMKKLPLLEEREANMTKITTFWSSTSAYINFMKAQGPVVGSFVGMGMLMSGFQRFFKNTVDEFTTAMKVSEELRIPVRLGDAPQSQTLMNIKKVVSVDTLNPILAYRAAKHFLFAAFGLVAIDEGPMRFRPPLQRVTETNIEKVDQTRVEWINIPDVYFKKGAMASTLTPLLLFIIVPTLISFIPIPPEEAHSDIVRDSLSTLIEQVIHSLPPVLSNPYQSAAHYLDLINSYSLSPVQEALASFASNAFAMLLLVRLGKLIGSDRDMILAQSIQKTCQEFPGGEVVAVLGMLHCNGVVRWVMSGQDPLASEEV